MPAKGAKVSEFSRAWHRADETARDLEYKRKRAQSLCPRIKTPTIEAMFSWNETTKALDVRFESFNEMRVFFFPYNEDFRNVIRHLAWAMDVEPENLVVDDEDEEEVTDD